MKNCFVINNSKNKSSDVGFEGLFEKLIAIPIADKDNLPKKMEDLNRQLEKVQLNTEEEDCFNIIIPKTENLGTVNRDASAVMSAPARRNDLFFFEALGGGSNAEDLQCTSEKLNG